MNAEDFLNDKQPTTVKDEKSTKTKSAGDFLESKSTPSAKVKKSADSFLDKNSAESFLDDEDEPKSNKLGYGLDRIVKHPGSAIISEFTSLAEMVTGLPKMAVEDISTLLVPGALSAAEKVGVIKKSTNEAKVAVGVAAGQKLSKDLGFDILAKAPTKIAEMSGFDKETLESSGLNLTMQAVGKSMEYVADQIEKQTGVAKAQTMAMFDIGMIKLGDAIHPVTKKLNDKFVDKMSNVTETEVKAYREEFDRQSAAYQEYTKSKEKQAKAEVKTKPEEPVKEKTVEEVNKEVQEVKAEEKAAEESEMPGREKETDALQKEMITLDMMPPTVKVDPIKQRDWTTAWSEDVKDAIGVNTRASIADKRLVLNLMNKMKEIVPDEAERSKIWEAINRGTVDQLADKSKELAKIYIDEMDKLGNRFKDEGLIKGLLDDYATRIIDLNGVDPKVLPDILKGLEARAKDAPTTSRFGKSRAGGTFDDFLQAIDKAGLKLKTTDLAEVFKEYGISMYKASENKKLIDKLKDTSFEGAGIFIDKNKNKYVPSNYVMFEQGQFSGYAVHPEIAPALKFVIDAREPGMFIKAAGTLTAAIKRLLIGLSFFHGTSLTMANLFANVPKDIYYGNVYELIREIRNGVLKELHEGGLGDSVDSWLRDAGLGLGMSEDVGRGAITQIAEVADRLVQKYTGFEGDLAQKATKPVGWFQEKLDYATWTVLHDGLKLFTAEKYLEKAKIDHPNKPEAELRKEIASAVNNIFGGLDWYGIARDSNNKFAESMKMAMFSPEGRRVLQTVLFAPDWTLSTIRAFTEAIPKNLLKPTEWDIAKGLSGLQKPLTKEDYARRYQMRYALYYLTLFNAINMATSGHPIWDNKDKTTIDLGNGQTLAFAKHPNEPFDWIGDFDKTLAYKLGFIPRSIVMMLGGVEYASPTAPKLKDQSLEGRSLAVAKGAVPFSVSGLSNGWQQALSGFIGLPIRGPKNAEPLKPSLDKAIKNVEHALGIKVKKHADDFLDSDEEEE